MKRNSKVKETIEEYADNHPQSYSNEIPKALENILLNNNFNSILDAGCGDGSLIRAIVERRVAKRSSITGIDLSRKRIQKIKKIFPQVKLFVDSVENMSKIKSNSVDLLISTQVIEHVDDKKMIKSLARATKKEGIVYLSTVFKKWYGWYPYRANNKWVLDPTHLREYQRFSELTNPLKKD
ncbi:MAG: class I SAM-dependent methyltransferase, partial [Flavobacterium sp.]|nr:class I SAM-dependent methyltransferase [Flavobacterium sp.]